MHPEDRLALLWSLILREPRGVTRAEFNAHLSAGISRQTLYRMIQRLRERHGAQIEYDASRHWKLLNRAAIEVPVHRFYGLWNSAGALFALVATFRLMRCFRQGVLAEFINGQVANEIEAHLERQRPGAVAHVRRIKLEPIGEVDADLELFEAVCRGLFERRRLRIDHQSLIDGHRVKRVVSPQRLVRYRDNWYLDTWCHHRRAVRTFELGGLRKAELVEPAVKARDVDEVYLDKVFDAGYGIYAGRKVRRARLRFAWPASLRASQARWHPQQKVVFHGDPQQPGFECTLTVPYSRSPELVADIMRWGASVRVLAPRSLREEVLARWRRR